MVVPSNERNLNPVSSFVLTKPLLIILLSFRTTAENPEPAAPPESCLNGNTIAESDVASNIIGLVATSEDADAKTFPQDTPIFATSVGSLLGKAGSKGTLGKSLDAIYDQADAQIVVVRVASSAKPAEQKAAIIKGAKILRQAPVRTGFKPKIIGAPELDDADVTAELCVAATPWVDSSMLLREGLTRFRQCKPTAKVLDKIISC